MIKIKEVKKEECKIVEQIKTLTDELADRSTDRLIEVQRKD